MKTTIEGCLIIGASVLLSSCGVKQPQVENGNDSDSTMTIAVGSYASPDEEGITLVSFDARTGGIKRISGLKGISNPSFLTLSPDATMIYSVGEDGNESSTVNVVRIERGDSLSLLGSYPTYGGSPCYINLSPDGNHVLTANYMGGNVTIYSLDDKGMPIGKPQLLEFAAGNPATQSHGEPRLHSVTFSPDGKLLLAADLGTDKVHLFPLNNGNDSLLVDAGKMRDVELRENSGPRHIVYKDDCAYVINEISGEVTVLRRGGDTFRPVQYIASDSVGGHGSGDIHFSPDKRYLYTSNRLKSDGISIFEVNGNGLLTKKGYLDTGSHPRNFMVTEDWLLVACRDTNAIEVYRRDMESGLPDKRAVTTFTVSRPVCLLPLLPSIPD